MGDYEITGWDVCNARHGYYANISYLDAKIGELLDTLEACGMRESTAILFTSDHGDFLGERGLWYKMSFLEPSARVPMILHWPERFAPRRVREPVSLADVAPTLAGLAGRADVECDGSSLVSLAGGAEETRAVYGEYLAEGVTAPMFMIRRGEWKYVRCGTDPDQLFDLPADPRELNNLAAAPEHADLVAGLVRECEARWDAARLAEQVTASQRARHMLFQALRRGAHFPWDYQPLRKASEQYTRNHMDVTGRDQLSRLPQAPQPEKRS